MLTTKKSKKFIIVAIVIVIIIVAMMRIGKKNVAAENQNTALQTEEVTKRDLVKSVGTTGTIVSKKARNLTVSLVNTEIKKVCVEEGDTVKKGDKLLVLDTSDAKKNLSDAKDMLEKTKKRNELSKADAARSVDDAEAARDYQVSVAKDAKDAAYSDYKNAKKTYNEEKKKLQEFKETEKLAKTTYHAQKDSASEIAYSIAAANRKQQEEVVSVAKKQMKIAETTYYSQKRAYNQTISSQNSAVKLAKSSQQSAILSQDTSSQEVQIRQYQKQVDDGILYAPFDGTVTSINYEEGENYTGGTLITLQDCSSYEVEAEIGEYDISDMKEGLAVIIKTNATGEEEMTGKITNVSPVSVSSSSSASANGMASVSAGMTGSDVLYKVRISIDNPSERLRLDMSANLSIIIEEHKNALTVPYNAVQTDVDGKNFVTVVKEDGSTENVTVDVIMESNYYTEISNEQLKEGMKVSTEQEKESTNSFGNMIQIEGGF